MYIYIYIYIILYDVKTLQNQKNDQLMKQETT